MSDGPFMDVDGLTPKGLQAATLIFAISAIIGGFTTMLIISDAITHR